MHQTALQPSHYRPEIDGLRAIAVIAVIMFHAFPNIAPGGFVGVDIFFVISGYLISRIIFSGLLESKFSFQSFYAHRIKRIFPALIALLLGCLAIGWFVMMPDEYAQLGYHISASGLFVENITLWREVGYFDTAAELKPLLHLWSLSVEEQFYLLYPLLVWAAWKVRMNLLVLVLLSGALSLAVNIGIHAQSPNDVFYLLHTRFWELLAGGAIAYQGLHKPGYFFNSGFFGKKNILPNLFSITGLLLIFSVIAGLYSTKPNALLIEWGAAVVGACFLVGSQSDAWINRHILANRPIVYIGLISYPLYLWHWSLLSFLRLLQPDHHISSLQKLATVTLSFVMAWITYQWIEKPFRYGKNSDVKCVSLFCLLMIISLSGFYIFKHEGLPSRYPKQVNIIATYKFDELAYAMADRCWFDTDIDVNRFTPQCLGALASHNSKNTILVWGDSHAAHIYPAIDDLFGGNHDVAEYTRSACPPIIGTGDSYCVLGNNYVLSIIKQHVPDTVVLFAFWGSYADRWESDTPIAVQLLNTVHALQSAGVKNILLLGPAPQWNDKLPHLVMSEMMGDAPRYKISQRLNHGYNSISSAVDADLKALVSHEKHLQYFSTFNALCNVDGCLVRTSDDPSSLTSYDYAHLTGYGARHVAKQLPLPLNQ